ncbi:MAG: winged helix-turn-helix domain-containing protein [Methanobacteriota archaeon]
MTKITLDRETFRALASDTRLEILKVLDGKKLSLNDIMRSTSLNKATLHEHLSKLNEAGLVKRQEREGHKWVYYRLTWKGESLLHPENTRIVVLFTTTFVVLWVGILQLIAYVKGTFTNIRYDIFSVGQDTLLMNEADTQYLTNYSYAPSAGSGVPLVLPENLQKILSFINDGKSAMAERASSIPLSKNLSAIQTDDTVFDSTIPGMRYVVDKSEGVLHAVYQDPVLLYIAIACFLIFTVVLCVSLWRLWENRAAKL